MPTRKKKETETERWMRLSTLFSREFPQLMSFLTDPENFLEVRIKFRPDGTYLLILKGYGDDGGPIVCFGVGYDVILSMLAVEKTIAGNGWRPDKPWNPNGK
jgi:hypothetical protein